MMIFLEWLLNNFGVFFGGIFLIYLYLMIRRLTELYDYLRFVPKLNTDTARSVGKAKALDFLEILMERFARTVSLNHGYSQPIIDAIWSEVDCRISIHFTALNGYVNTLILIGFAGTIFGSIGAFNEMFQGLAQGEPASSVFVASWNHGLATALYTSLGAAAIGGTVITLICSRYLMSRARRLETMVALRINEIIEENLRHDQNETAPKPVT
jgi:hypothetical protein